jgi:hypothetical protein
MSPRLFRLTCSALGFVAGVLGSAAVAFAR